MKEKILNDAIEEMRKLKKDADRETAHILADGILCDVIKAICGEQGEELVSEFESLHKWYA